MTLDARGLTLVISDKPDPERDAVAAVWTAAGGLLLDRAIARGEVRPAVASDRIAAVPYALLQQEFFMTLKPVPNAVIEEIVDTIFLPLLGRPARGR